jgi:hypothetical protein
MVMTKDYRIIIDEQRLLPLRGDGRILTSATTYYFWYRARHNKWYMGIHLEKPVLNARCDSLEYDDAPVFHCADIKATHVTPGQIDGYINECVTAYRGPVKNYTSTPI